MQIIKHYFGYFDTLQYPLIFSNGDTGCHEGIKRFIKGVDDVVGHATCIGEKMNFDTCADPCQLLWQRIKVNF